MHWRNEEKKHGKPIQIQKFHEMMKNHVKKRTGEHNAQSFCFHLSFEFGKTDKHYTVLYDMNKAIRR